LSFADEVVIHLVRANDVVQLRNCEEEDVFPVAKDVRPHETIRFFQQRQPVREVAVDHEVLRILAVSAEGAEPGDHPLGLFAFSSPSGSARRRFSTSSSFARATSSPCSKRRSPAPGSAFLTWPRISGRSVGGRSLQRGLEMSISPTQRMPYLSSQARIASFASCPSSNLARSFTKFSSSN